VIIERRVPTTVPRDQWFDCICDTACYIIRMSGLSQLTVEDGDRKRVFKREDCGLKESA